MHNNKRKNREYKRRGFKRAYENNKMALAYFIFNDEKNKIIADKIYLKILMTLKSYFLNTKIKLNILHCILDANKWRKK